MNVFKIWIRKYSSGNFKGIRDDTAFVINHQAPPKCKICNYYILIDYFFICTRIKIKEVSSMANYLFRKNVGKKKIYFGKNTLKFLKKKNIDAIEANKLHFWYRFQNRRFLRNTFFWNNGKLINPQAVGRDSGVPFSLSNFLDDILKPTSIKVFPT